MQYEEQNRLVLIVVAIVLAIAGISLSNTQDQIDDLEDRVTTLETSVNDQSVLLESVCDPSEDCQLKSPPPVSDCSQGNGIPPEYIGSCDTNDAPPTTAPPTTR